MYHTLVQWNTFKLKLTKFQVIVISEHTYIIIMNYFHTTSLISLVTWHPFHDFLSPIFPLTYLPIFPLLPYLKADFLYFLNLQV